MTNVILCPTTVSMSKVSILSNQLAFRSKPTRVRTTNALEAMHGLHSRIACYSFRGENGRIPISISAAGKCGVFAGVAGMYGHYGIGPESFAADVSEVFIVSEF